MWKHYLKLAFRHLLKGKGHSLINILGLALGMACCLLALLFLRDEIGYDRFHEKADRIYRITQEVEMPGHPKRHGAVTATVLGPTLRDQNPDVIDAARLMPYFEGSLPGDAAVSYNNERQFYDRFFWADRSIFHIFSLSLIAGDPQTVLDGPNTLVLSESTAWKYFGDDEPIGKVLRIDTGFSDEEYRVTGVVSDLPYNSHFHFDVLASFSSLDHVKDQRVVLNQWWLADAYTYVLLREGATGEQLAAALPAFVERNFPKIEGVAATLYPQPLTDIHLRSHLLLELEINGDISYVYIFSAIALLTLLIACVNFINLSTARYAHRTREVGVRKVVGAHRSQLVQQFLGESILLCAVAIVLAVVLVEWSLPVFNAFSGKAIELGYDLSTCLGLLGLTLFVGLVAGSYPAFFLAGFKPIEVLKSSLTAGAASGGFRKALIVLQFVVSVTLLIGTGIIYDQLRYMRSQDLGFDAEQVLVLPIRDVDLRSDFLFLKDEVAGVPNIIATTFSSLVIGREPPQIGVAVEGIEGTSTVGTLIVDYDFQDVFKVDLVAGRSLSRDDQEDLDSAFLINEAAIEKWGWSGPEEALGKAVAWGGWKKGEIVGVVRNFHHQPLRFPLEPLILHIRPIAMHYMYIRVAPEELPQTLQALESTWHRIRPSKPFEYFFLDDEYDRAYRAEDRLGKVVGLFSTVAVFVACLGLLGLASFTAERRTREIGIRKVLGSSISEVVMLLSKEFVMLVIIANLIAWPLAFLVMKNWLEDFAFRTEIEPQNFVQGGLAALVIAWLTVSYRALTAALRDPAKALRYE